MVGSRPGGRTRPSVQICPLLRLILDIAARRGRRPGCARLRVGHRGESSPTGAAPRIVPRLRTSPTRAPTRTERHLGPPVTRFRPVNEAAGGPCTTDRGGGNDDRPPVGSTDGPADRSGDQDHRARHDPAESSTVILAGLAAAHHPHAGVRADPVLPHRQPVVRGRRERVQIEANQVILEHTADLPPTNSELPIGMGSMVRLNRRLSSFR